MIGTTLFATAAGSLPMEGPKAPSPPATGPAFRLVETAFASFNLQSAQGVADTLQRENACGDITFFFLHKNCSTLRKRHFGHIHLRPTPL